MNFKPILFLDFDGVMCTESQQNQLRHIRGDMREIYPFDRKCVKVLNEIIEITDADIVVSSDWRLYFKMEQMHHIFDFNKIIKSPIAYTVDNYKDYNINTLEDCRASEIIDYIQNNNVKRYIAVDDLDLSLYFPYNFTLCGRPREGIKQSGIKEKILNILQPF